MQNWLLLPDRNQFKSSIMFIGKLLPSWVDKPESVPSRLFLFQSSEDHKLRAFSILSTRIYCSIEMPSWILLPRCNICQTMRNPKLLSGGQH